ncbi:MAG: tRNA uridine-5-carboxymethylaminomethyl(34) synthesis GTPase MnmE [Candidatus Izemoplasmatales bacterium]|jgi:tRNA modification GTPase|nr:tRNA uridine-5-carboxymethylaminomethyl(34) synthesis GTPase MnmE [Candidatus Izemoplasmatales bacterium]
MILDTIVGKATASGPAALNIIRISGDEAIAIVDRVFKGENLLLAESHTIAYGHIRDKNHDIDEVMVSIYRRPRSFTAEDTVEITCHGGDFVASEIIRVLLREGARLAYPGEFTRRAYQNGRIDLTEAEAIMDVINAKTSSQLSLAQNAIGGAKKETIQKLQNQLLGIIAEIEVNIDYPEYDDRPKVTNKIILQRLTSLIEEIKSLINNASTGKIIREGIKTVIVGKPNVGKSSLLNSLIKEDKAIVTDISGTTRDLVEAELNLNGLLIKLIDTAGIRDTSDIVESIGIEKTKKAISESDLVLLVLDQSDHLTDLDFKLLEITKDKKRILVGNKVDLGMRAELKNENVIPVSAKNNIGLDVLSKAVESLFLGNLQLNEPVTLFDNVRHIAKLEEALVSLEEAEKTALQGLPVDVIGIDLNDAWRYLGEITGENASDSLLDTLFSRFCLGK